VVYGIVVSSLVFSSMGCAATGKPADNEQKIPKLDNTSVDMVNVVDVLHQSGTCGNITESQWITDQQKYLTSFQGMSQRVISDKKPETAVVDFKKNAVIVIAMGHQRTGGYSVKLASTQIAIKNNRATISVEWRRPMPGMFSIQMITNPCLFVTVPHGDYASIDVVDQTGKRRATLSTK
jgi:hypothetical protein